MSSNQRTIICGHLAEEPLRRARYDDDGADGEGGGVATDAAVVPLRLLGDGANASLHVEHIRDPLGVSVPDRFVDLAEIATYVYVADQAVPRGGAGVEDMGLNWRRKLEFHVPVREPDFWSSPEVLSALTETLGFLSEDDYHFEFTPDPEPGDWRSYQMSMFGDAEPPGGWPEQVVLFSGGLDSLGGAVRECVVDRRRVALVTHRPTRKLDARQGHLRDLLAGYAGAFRPWHLPVEVNKKKYLNREYTQRSRSFLFAALAATVAHVLRRDGIRFYENGVVSLNLPLSPQAVGAKATRTTHPRVLAGFRRLLSLVAERPFGVENPFAWHTKAEVVRSIAAAGCGELIGWSTSGRCRASQAAQARWFR